MTDVQVLNQLMGSSKSPKLKSKGSFGIWRIDLWVHKLAVSGNKRTHQIHKFDRGKNWRHPTLHQFHSEAQHWTIFPVRWNWCESFCFAIGSR